jgi:histidinol-phosphate aminotransferase
MMDEILERARRLELNRYPDHTSRALREELAAYAGVEPEWVWVGTGSNEILLDACLAYGGAGRSALLFTPTYSMHHRQARIAGTTTLELPRADGFKVDVARAVDAINRLRPDIVFLCTPNNPTGTLTPLDDVFEIADACPGLMIVDEAYFEFCDTTVVPELEDLPQVIVARTLSKAFRLAGARLGYAVAQPETLHPLLKVRMPYAQSSLSQVAALVAVERRDEMLLRVSKIVAERERVYGELSGVPGVEAFPSRANFVLFRHADSARLADGLRNKGVFVSGLTSTPGCEGCLRVTAGTRPQNNLFLEALRALV